MSLDAPKPRPDWRRAAAAKGGRTRWDRDAARRGIPPGPRIIRLADCDPITAECIRRIMAADENLKRREAAEAADAA